MRGDGVCLLTQRWGAGLSQRFVSLPAELVGSTIEIVLVEHAPEAQWYTPAHIHSSQQSERGANASQVELRHLLDADGCAARAGSAKSSSRALRVLRAALAVSSLRRTTPATGTHAPPSPPSVRSAQVDSKAVGCVHCSSPSMFPVHRTLPEPSLVGCGRCRLPQTLG